MTKALFLDRDGTINVDTGYVHEPEKFIFIEGIFDFCRAAQNAGYLIIVITNQSGIERGYFSEADYQRLNAHMIAEFAKNGVTITDTFHCPSLTGPDRKPAPGLFLKAQKRYDIDMSASVNLGDKDRDMEAGKTAGVGTNILFGGMFPTESVFIRTKFFTPNMHDIRVRILKFAQGVNRMTPWLAGIKKILGLHRLAERCLVKRLSSADISDIKTTLRTDIIQQRIDALKSAGPADIHFYILLVMSMGDIVAAEPMVRHLKQLAPRSKVHWVINKGFVPLIEANPNIDEIIPVASLFEGYVLCRAKESESSRNILINCHFDGTACGDGIISNPINPRINIYSYYSLGSLLLNFCLAAGLPPIDEAPVFYLRQGIRRPDFGTDDYIVFHCRSNGADRNWTDLKWNRLAKALSTDGHHIVEIGTERVLAPGISERIIDYTGRKDIQTLAAIIKDAKLLVGVDSVFAHVANGLRTPALILLGKYMNFNSYTPYSGDFSRSHLFRTLRAPGNAPAAAISNSTVVKATRAILAKPT